MMLQRVGRGVLCGMGLLAASLACAQDAPEPAPGTSTSRNAAEDVPEYGGLVLAQVLTSLGLHFHTKFAESWSSQKDAEAHVLLVRERLSPKVGTEIQVLSGDAVVFRSVLPRSYAVVALLADSAAEQVQNKVTETALQNLLFNDPDMARSAY